MSSEKLYTYSRARSAEPPPRNRMGFALTFQVCLSITFSKREVGIIIIGVMKTNLALIEIIQVETLRANWHLPCGCVCVCVCVFSCSARQAPLSTRFSRQEHWSGLPFPSPGDLPDPGIKPASPALQADSLLSEPPGKLMWYIHVSYCCYGQFYSIQHLEN